ncbi:MAG TPA: DUF1003 domain-containing protein [Thermomicrobiales bacterium]|jgi:uncharacterized membrane protein
MDERKEEMRDGHGHGLRDEWHLLTHGEQRAIEAIVHRHRVVHNVNELATERLTTGQRVADAVARNMGSWRFIITQTCLLTAWVTVNAVGWSHHWDPYPFILLNLALSFQAAYAAPIIMMSQNRQEAKDRLRAEEDYQINFRAETEVAAINARLDQLAGEQWELLLALQHEQLAILRRLDSLTVEVHRVTCPPA